MTALQPIHVVETVVVVFFAVLCVGYGVLLLQAARLLLRDARHLPRRAAAARALAASRNQPSVTIVVPAHDEQEAILATVRSLLAQDWLHLEVLVVPNGCTDATVPRLQAAFALHPTAELLGRPRAARGRILATMRSASDPRLRVITTSGGGKADAVNCALERASGEFVLLVDADSLLPPHAVARATLPFVEHGEHIAVVSAGIRVLNGSRVDEHGRIEPALPRTPLALLQCLEYARAFHIGRAGWASLGALPMVSGAFGMFRADVLRACGGLDPRTVGEDLEVVLRLHATVRYRGRRPGIHFLPEALCWTEVPEDIRSLRAQRIRWHRGLAESVRRHRRLLLDPRHGALGMLSFPFLGVFELLAPLVELAGLLTLALAAASGVVSWSVVLALALFAVGFGAALTMAALLLEQVRGTGVVTRPRDVSVLFLTALAEQLGYRQRTALWRLRGLGAGLRAGATDPSPAVAWGEMHHHGARSVAAQSR